MDYKDVTITISLGTYNELMKLAIEWDYDIGEVTPETIICDMIGQVKGE